MDILPAFDDTFVINGTLEAKSGEQDYSTVHIDSSGKILFKICKDYQCAVGMVTSTCFISL